MRARAVLVLVAAAWPLLGVGCDDRTIGRMCEVLPGVGDAGAGEGRTLINDQALECRTQLCLQQSPGASIAHDVDTGPFCTADCRVDSDCAAGQRREARRNGDRRCRSGYYCGHAFVTGTIAPYRRLCLCRDFGISTPAE